MEQYKHEANSAVRSQNQAAKKNFTAISMEAKDAIMRILVASRGIINDAHESLAHGMPLSLSDDHLKLSRAMQDIEKSFTQKELPYPDAKAVTTPAPKKRGRPRKNAASTPAK